jgi:hypothetical protein
MDEWPEYKSKNGPYSSLKISTVEPPLDANSPIELFVRATLPRQSIESPAQAQIGIIIAPMKTPKLVKILLF